jgi:uncharacterized PurR-regulated membrane protein YhhQ (DUF165 family)
MVNIMIKVFELSVRIVRLTLIAFIIMQLVNIALQVLIHKLEPKEVIG